MNKTIVVRELDNEWVKIINYRNIQYIHVSYNHDKVCMTCHGLEHNFSSVLYDNTGRLVKEKVINNAILKYTANAISMLAGHHAVVYFTPTDFLVYLSKEQLS